MGDTRITVAIVDDQTLVREGLATLLSLTSDIQVVGTAGDAEQAFALVDAQIPDVVLMDVRMPGMNGVAATQKILARHPGIRVIVVSTFDDDEYVFGSLRVGAAGYLLKNADPDSLARAIRAVHAGHSMLDPSITRKVIRRMTFLADRSATEPAISERLTRRERQVLRMVVGGLSNSQIARRISLSEGTVKNHVSHILSKLGARDRAHAVSLAVRWGLMDD